MRDPDRLSLLLAVAASGCVAYNPDCEPDDTSVVGRTDTILDLRPELIRTREAPVGNLVSDAYYAHLRADGARAAVVNAGSIHDRTECQVAEIIDRGPIRLGQLAGMLPIDNLVVLVEVSETELWDVLEHSVARLGDLGDAGIAGRFLQVSHLRFDVDCDRPAATADQVGNRVTAITWIDEAQDGSTTEHVLNREARNDPSLGACDDGGGNPAPCLIKIAVNDFLGGGGEGYEWLRTKIAIAEERPDFVAVANYIANQPDQTVSPAIEGRINLDSSCTRLLE